MASVSKTSARQISILPPSRTSTERMMEVHRLLKDGKYPNCQKMAKTLEVSTKTIQRDLEFMKTRMGFPIEYDAERYGFYYTEPVENFPLVQVSEGELVALYVAQMALRQYAGTPFEEPLRNAFGKITAGLTDKLSLSWEDLDARFSFRSLGATTADLVLFNDLSRAVLQSMEVEFEYRKLYPTQQKSTSSRHSPKGDGGGYEKRRVRPYHLRTVDGQWYLFGFDRKREEMRTFVLSRMRKVHVTAFHFQRPKDFSIAEHLGQSFGVYKGQGSHTIRIWFDSFAAQLVRERQWHPSQKIKELKKGELELTLTLESLPEIERWILSWGARAKVLSPVELRQSIATTVTILAKGYAVK